jgi:hypothetical protein
MHIVRTNSKAATRCFTPLLGLLFVLCITTNVALADDRINLEQLTPQWWQWAFSIPTAQNPIFDQTGGSCMVGQRGSIWFLAGNFGGTTRSCSIPAGTSLFIPVINQVGYNSPNTCGQDATNLSAKEMRKVIGDFIGSVRLSDVSVDLDSKTIYNLERVKSDVFAIALPADNFVNNFVPCAAGIYSPAVDDGYYVKLDPLTVGNHNLHIRVTAPFSLDVTYNLVVVKVTDK